MRNTDTPTNRRLHRARPAGRAALAAGVCGLVFWVTPRLLADQVVLEKDNFPGAKIIGLEDGRIRFRTAAGDVRQVWPSEVKLIVVDRGGVFVDLNEAERYSAAREPAQAVVRYRRALRLSQGFWSDLVETRLLTAYDRAKDIHGATLSFIRVVRGEGSGPAAAVRLIPRSIPTVREARVVRAIEQLDGAIAASRDEEQLVPLRLFRYELLLGVGDPRASAALKTVATMEIPKALRSERAYSIQLAALTSILQDGAGAAAFASLDRAIRGCSKRALPSFLLLKGEALLARASTREEFIRAAWPFMRVVIHMPADARAAEGLYGAARAVEQIGRFDRAIALLEECLRHRRLGDATRQKAKQALDRLRADPAHSR